MKIICPNCNKRIKDTEEICPYCGHYFSLSDTQIDSEGRPYSIYQESQHEEHYDDYDVKPVNTIENPDLNESTDFGEKRLNDYQDIKAVTQNEVEYYVKEIYRFDKAKGVGLIFFALIWFFVEMIIFVLSIADEEFDLPFFPLLFFIIGIIIVISSVKKKSKMTASLMYLSCSDYSAFLEYVDKTTAEMKIPSLLYAGSFVAFYMTKEDERAKKMFKEAISQSPNQYFFVAKYFSYIVKTLDLTEDVKKASAIVYADKD